MSLESALKHADTTKMVVLETDILGRLDLFAKKMFGDQSLLIVADRNTVGFAESLLQSGSVVSHFVFQDKELHAEISQVEKLTDILSQVNAIPVAVGSGTINDLTKLASHRCGRPYMIVATAASMDGYTAFGASIESGGYKQTFDCPAPVAVVVDLDVVSAAPAEMSASGYADLLAKIPAGADWILADFFGTEPIQPEAWDIVQTQLRTWLSEPEGVARADRRVLAHLMEGLIMSGLAMQKAKSSRPASGAEHQFSHLWDNQHHTFHGKTPSHGFKVGIGTLATSTLYEKVLKLQRQDFEHSLSRVAEYRPDWDDIERAIRKRFPKETLVEQVIQQSRAKYVSLDVSMQRIQKVIEHWDGLRDQLESQLMTADDIRERLRKSGAPYDSTQIGIDHERLLLSHELTQLIRMRYNVLDFVLETGMWDRLIF